MASTRSLADKGSEGGDMCWPTEWFQEDLPLEDKESRSLDKQVEVLYNESVAVPPLLENFGRAPRGLPSLQLPPPEAPHKESVLVFSDSAGLCRRIIESAPEGRVGTRKIVEDCRQLSQDDVGELLAGQKGGWDLIVYGYGMDAPRSNAATSVVDQQDIAVRLCFWLLQEILRTEVTTTRLAILTRGVFAEDPGQHRRHGLQLVTGAPLFGMANTARLEMELPVQYVDTEWALGAGGDPHRLLPRLASELFRRQTFGHNSVRVLHGGRYVLRRVASGDYEAAGRALELPTEGTVAISGGNGALGLVMGEYLLELAERRGAGGFALRFLSRSARVGEANEARWRAVQARAARLGVPVEQATCDFSSQLAVDELVRGLGGSLTGFIHAAGEVKDAMLANLTWERFDAVFDPKHRAALFLHGALERHENPGLRFLWLFSSISVFGNLGQLNYAASNACLDALARYRAGRGRPGLAIQWGAWGEVGMAATMGEGMRRRVDAGACPFFSVREALAGLEAGLRTGLPGFTVLKYNPEVLRAQVRQAETAMQCSTRNFYAEIMPPPPSQTLDRHHVYTFFRETQGSYQEAQKHRLVHDTYTKRFLEEEEEEWGDDFRKWAK